jgi:hypothetical protein
MAENRRPDRSPDKPDEEDAERLEHTHRGQLRRALIASTVGTTIEWYDFLLYGTVSALVFGPLFFPKSDPLMGSASDIVATVPAATAIFGFPPRCCGFAPSQPIYPGFPVCWVRCSIAVRSQSKKIRSHNSRWQPNSRVARFAALELAGRSAQNRPLHRRQAISQKAVTLVRISVSGRADYRLAGMKVCFSIAAGVKPRPSCSHPSCAPADDAARGSGFSSRSAQAAS